jgi:hypothetical protein
MSDDPLEPVDSLDLELRDGVVERGGAKQVGAP